MLGWLAFLALNPVFGQSARVGPVPLPPALPAATPGVIGDSSGLEEFLECFHRELIRERPDLYRAKLERAAMSDFEFFRAFPQLGYAELRRRRAGLGRSPVLRLHGDAHGRNVVLIEFDGRRTPALSDFDDSDRGPVSVELARMLTGAALLAGGDRPRRLERAAARAYAESLGMKIDQWLEVASREKAVTKAEPEARDWRNEGRPLEDRREAARILRAAGRTPAGWRVRDRRGAGSSSIGVRRYVLVPRRGRGAWELKELRGPALEYWTGRRAKVPPRERVAAALGALRYHDDGSRTLRFEGRDWLLRPRQAVEAALSFEHPRSAARVLGGLLAQAHRAQGISPARLRAALESLPKGLVRDSLRAVRRLRRELSRLLARPEGPGADRQAQGERAQAPGRAPPSRSAPR